MLAPIYLPVLTISGKRDGCNPLFLFLYPPPWIQITSGSVFLSETAFGLELASRVPDSLLRV